MRYPAVIPTTLLLASTALLPAQRQITLLADINAGNQSPASYPASFTRFSGVTFAAYTNALGRELYTTAGQPNTTALLKDIQPGTGSSSPQGFTLFQNRVYFAADDGQTGAELWVSDGTPAGTQRLHDIRPGAAGSAPAGFAVLGPRLYFSADDGSAGRELWVTDGTTQGTRLVVDLDPGAGHALSQDTTLLVQGTRLFFCAQQPVSGAELWVSDGSANGTVMVKDINPGAAHGVLRTPGLVPVALGNQVVFVADDGQTGWELWRSDGTAAGTNVIADLVAGRNSFPYPEGLRALGSVLLFTIHDALWRSDTTAAGTVKLKDLGNAALTNTNARVVLGSRMYFGARLSTGAGLWASDGSAQGTVLLASGFTSSGIRDLVAVGTDLYFHGEPLGGNLRAELWRSDGTAPGTALVRDIWPNSGSSAPAHLAPGVLPGQLLFSADDGIHGHEVWTSDGTSLGTLLLADLNFVPGTSQSSSPQHFHEVHGTLFFTADDGNTGRELYRTDGTTNGTRLVRDITPGAVGADPYMLASLGDTLFFNATDGVTGREPWVSRGGPGDTRLLLDIRQGGDSFAENFIPLEHVMLFRAYDGNRLSTNLWRSDGTTAGTVQLSGGFAGFDYPAVYRGAAYFAAQDPNRGTELWATDGSTVWLVIDLDPRVNSRGPESSSPTELTVMGDTLYFVADQGKGGGRQLFATDGTAFGTRLVSPAAATGALTGAVSVTVVGKALYHFMNNRLWYSDGSAPGTVAVGPTILNPGGTLAFDDLLLFTNSDLFGRELWVSDGTDPGTGRLTDINPGGGSSSVSFMCQAGAREVFFAAENASNGVELWSINRSLPTPQMVQNLHPDLGPNARSSNPRFMQMLNGRLVFVADDGTHGYELMQLFPGATARNTGHGCRADGPAPTIGSSDPILGSKLSVSVDSGRALQHGVVVLGLPNRSARDLGYGCELWFDPGLPHFVLPILTLQSGVATRDFQIPNTPALQGGTVVLQAGLGPTNTAPLGADLSAGLQLTVGL